MDKNNLITIYPKDYSLDIGIYSVEAATDEYGDAHVVGSDDFGNYTYTIYAGEYFLDKEDIIEWAEQDREKEINYHKEQIEKLEKLDFGESL